MARAKETRMQAARIQKRARFNNLEVKLKRNSSLNNELCELFNIYACKYFQKSSKIS
jgi:hypothetical protein